AVGEVDVLCTHNPPQVPEQVYDTLAPPLETGTPAQHDPKPPTPPPGHTPPTPPGEVVRDR
ncbi:hypothetical protein ABZ016_27455, partial [Streptomyces sp. NPDC006372]